MQKALVSLSKLLQMIYLRVNLFDALHDHKVMRLIFCRSQISDQISNFSIVLSVIYSDQATKSR